MTIDDLKTKALAIKLNTQGLVNECEKWKLTDEQWFIDWEMEMSELVTKDHLCGS